MQNIDLVSDLRPVILAARQVRDQRNTLARFLPNRNVQAVSYRLGRRKRVDQTVPVRAIDAPATPIKRPGVLDVRGDLPAVTPIVDLSEQDLTNEMVLAQQLAGLQVDWEPWVVSAAAEVALATDNTFEVMRGQLLATTKIMLIAEDGATHEVDFGVSHDRIITAGAPWDFEDPVAVFADYSAAHEAHLDGGSGQPAGAVLTSSKMKGLLLNAVQKLFPQAPIGIDALNAYLSTRDLPPVVTYDRRLKDAAGVKRRVYPEGSMTFLPGADDPVGATELGVTQESVQQVQRRILSREQAPGMTIVTLGQDNPVQRSVKGASIGMPVLSDNDEITVLNGLIAE
ncbi:major capsid protein [Nocardioides sp. LHG3406-4]|uniref:major capsid protein n=1 Tax=Nocardioides sp. LHG3406-4 TaxID=2804575 RepID=UPI003CFA4928